MSVDVAIHEDSGETFEVSEAQVGREVRDSLGRVLGRVEKLFVNGRGEPEYVQMEVASGGDSLLLPAASVTVAGERH